MWLAIRRLNNIEDGASDAIFDVMADLGQCRTTHHKHWDRIPMWRKLSLVLNPVTVFLPSSSFCLLLCA